MIRRRSLSSFINPLLGLSFFVLLAGCGGSTDRYVRDVYPSPADFEVHGIDVSKYQGDIDWSAVRDSGVKFAWIKATEGGDNADEKFAQNWQMAKQAGVPRGAYHFAYWCRTGEEQASWFIAHVPNDPDALPPVLDLEWNGQSKTCPWHPSRQQALATIRTILTAMERAYGKKPVIYTSIDFHRDVLAGEFMDYPLWVRSVKDFPAVKYGNRYWHFWQHTAQGHVPGIRGYVDRNAFRGSVKDWQAWLAEATDERRS
jgi:lysozyme